MLIQVFKIDVKMRDGLDPIKFSDGGVDPTFTKNGKVWTTVGGFKNHLQQYPRYDRKGCVFLQYMRLGMTDIGIRIIGDESFILPEADNQYRTVIEYKDFYLKDWVEINMPEYYEKMLPYLEEIGNAA